MAPPGDRGFSYVDLVEDRSSRRLFALKRLACHSDDDVKTARREAEYMLGLRHRNLVPCDAYAVNAVAGSRTGVVCEVLIVMPYYKVCHHETRTGTGHFKNVFTTFALSLLFVMYTV